MTTDEYIAVVARQVMSDFLGLPFEECSANSRGALLIAEGIKHYSAERIETLETAMRGLLAEMEKHPDADALLDSRAAGMAYAALSGERKP